jgi:hypothetical protein
MEDTHSRAYGLAHTQILVELLRKLIQSRILTDSDVRTLLESSGRALETKGTEVAAAAMTHVQLIGEAVGVAPRQVDGRQ